MFGVGPATRIYLAAGATDLRKNFDGLYGLVRDRLAKNYLSEEELGLLNLIVDQYLSFAEFQARQRKPMYMQDWVKKLDDFLRLNERDILTNAGKISARLGEEIAYKEFDKYWEARKQLEKVDTVSALEASVQKSRNQREAAKPEKPGPRQKKP